MNVPVGQAVTVTFDTFGDGAETIPKDPTEAFFPVALPDGTTEVHTWPTGDLTHVTTGVFTHTIVPALGGTYAYTPSATGAVTTAQPGSFYAYAGALYLNAADVRTVLAGTGLASGTAAGLSDTDLNDAIIEAQTEVDGRLAARYTTPFANTPPIVVAVTRDIAAYLATLTYRRGEPIAPGEAVLLRYTRAQTLLTQMATGVFPLQIPGAAPGQDEAATEGTVTNPFDGDLWEPRDFRLATQPAGFPMWPRPW